MNVFEEIRLLLKQRLDFYEKRFEKMGGTLQDVEDLGSIKSYEDAIGLVNRVEKEYNNGWIPCSERLPEEAYGCLVTVIDCEPVTQTDFESILPYFVGYDGERWNDADGEEIPFEVIAWQPLPPAYKEEV